jgi:hypothetical protein
MALFSLTKDDDYASRKAAIARQEKLAEMLSQMGAQEQAVSTAGGITAPMSGMGALARGLTSFGGSYLSGKAAADEAAANKAARTEAIEARKTFNQEPDLVMPGGSARLTPTPGGNDAIPASPELPKYILQDDEAMAAGPQRSDTTLRPFNIMPKEQDVTFGNITSKVAPRSREDKNRLLDEYEMSDNPYLQKLSERLRTESKGEMFEGSKYGNFRRNADGSIETVVPATNEAADRSPFMQLLIDRDALIASGAKPDDPRVRALDAKINLETTRAPGTSVTVKMPPGLNSADESLGKMYAEYITGDTAAGQKNMNQLGMAINYMVKNPNISGGVTGALPVQVRALFPSLKPGANVQQMMEDVVQTNLKKVLGSQFIAKEAEGLMKRIYDPQLDAAVNVDRAIRLLKSVQEAAQAKDDAMRYFGQNNTISGYKPKYAMVRSVDDIIYNAGLTGVDVRGDAPGAQPRKPGVDYNNPLLR